MSTLLPTLAIELLVGGLFMRRYTAPLRFLAIAILANVATQAGLWAVLMLADPRYWAPLLLCEVAIWLIEAACFARFLNLERSQALRLSLAMNASSFGVGLLLPL